MSDGHMTIAEHWEPEPFKPDRCAECGGGFETMDEETEVVNVVTDERGVVHFSCYEANDDVLSLA